MSAIVTALSYKRMSPREREWIAEACQMRKNRTRSGLFRLRKLKEAFIRQFQVDISYEAMKGAVYTICQEKGIQRAVRKGRVPGGKRQYRKKSDGLMSRLERSEKRSEENERLVKEMKESISELMRLVKG